MTSGFTGIGSARENGLLGLNLIALMTVVPASLLVRARHSMAVNREHRRIIGNLEAILVDNSYALTSARKYAICVARFLGGRSVRDLTVLRDDDVVEFLDGLRENGLGNGSIRLHLCAIRAVFDRLLGLSITEGIVHVPRPAARAHASATELMQLRGACRCSRERLAVDLLNSLGVRPGQLVRFAYRHEAWPEGVPKVMGDRCSIVGSIPRVDGGFIPIVVDDGVGNSIREWLFPSRQRASGITTRTLQRIVTQLATRCGFRTTCTAIRLAEALPLTAAA